MDDVELPGWTIELSERSAGVWRLQARHDTGRTFETVDHDVDRAFQRLKDYDADLIRARPDSAPA
jgi:ATP phosphoribosyltransferase regulatory subunit HisZ